MILRIPWRKTPSKRRREIIVPKSAAPQDTRPIRAETRAKLVASIARGRRWLDEIVAGTVTDVELIAARESCSVRKVNMTISLSFLAYIHADYRPHFAPSVQRLESRAAGWQSAADLSAPWISARAGAIVNFMLRKVGHLFLALFLGLALVVGSVTQGVQASDMAVKMVTATGDMPMPGGCSGCSGDDGMPMACFPMACFALCGNVLAILPFAPTITADVSLSPPAPHTIPVAGLHGPPDPYPPRPTILG